MLTFYSLMSKNSSNDSCLLPIRAVPNASRSEVVGWEQDELKVKLKAVPEDGRANKELIRFFSKTLKIPKSAIVLESGEKSRHKRVKIHGFTRMGFFEKINMQDPHSTSE